MAKSIDDYPAQINFGGVPAALIQTSTAPGPTVQIDYTEKLLVGKYGSFPSSAHSLPVLPQTTAISTRTTSVRALLFPPTSALTLSLIQSPRSHLATA